MDGPGATRLVGTVLRCYPARWRPVKGSSIVGRVVLVWWHDDHPDFRRF
jgi:hypothetical protein